MNPVLVTPRASATSEISFRNRESEKSKNDNVAVSDETDRIEKIHPEVATGVPNLYRINPAALNDPFPPWLIITLALVITSLAIWSGLPIPGASDGRANWFDSSEYMVFFISEPWRAVSVPITRYIALEILFSFLACGDVVMTVVQAQARIL